MSAREDAVTYTAFSTDAKSEDAPRILPCGHSFTLRTIMQLAQHGSFITCPLDRKTLYLENGPSGVAVNYSLVNLLAETQKKPSRFLYCTMPDHEAMERRYWCQTDQQFICLLCKEESAAHAQHTVVPAALFLTGLTRLMRECLTNLHALKPSSTDNKNNQSSGLLGAIQRQIKESELLATNQIQQQQQLIATKKLESGSQWIDPSLDQAISNLTDALQLLEYSCYSAIPLVRWQKIYQHLCVLAQEYKKEEKRGVPILDALYSKTGPLPSLAPITSIVFAEQPPEGYECFPVNLHADRKIPAGNPSRLLLCVKRASADDVDDAITDVVLFQESVYGGMDQVYLNHDDAKKWTLLKDNLNIGGSMIVQLAYASKNGPNKNEPIRMLRLSQEQEEPPGWKFLSLNLNHTTSSPHQLRIAFSRCAPITDYQILPAASVDDIDKKLPAGWNCLDSEPLGSHSMQQAFLRCTHQKQAGKAPVTNITIRACDEKDILLQPAAAAAAAAASADSLDFVSGKRKLRMTLHRGNGFPIVAHRILHQYNPSQTDQLPLSLDSNTVEWKTDDPNLSFVWDRVDANSYKSAIAQVFTFEGVYDNPPGSIMAGLGWRTMENPSVYKSRGKWTETREGQKHTCLFHLTFTEKGFSGSWNNDEHAADWDGYRMDEKEDTSDKKKPKYPLEGNWFSTVSHNTRTKVTGQYRGHVMSGKLVFGTTSVPVSGVMFCCEPDAWRWIGAVDSGTKLPGYCEFFVDGKQSAIKGTVKWKALNKSFAIKQINSRTPCIQFTCDYSSFYKNGQVVSK